MYSLSSIDMVIAICIYKYIWHPYHHFSFMFPLHPYPIQKLFFSLSFYCQNKDLSKDVYKYIFLQKIIITRIITIHTYKKTQMSTIYKYFSYSKIQWVFITKYTLKSTYNNDLTKTSLLTVICVSCFFFFFCNRTFQCWKFTNNYELFFKNY